jgi:hypothetical protein
VVGYVVAGFVLTAVLKSDWTLGLFFLLAAVGYTTIALNIDQDQRELELRRDKAEKKAQRKPGATERSEDAPPPVERVPDLDERLADVRKKVDGQFKRSDVEAVTGLAKTASANLVKYGISTGQIESVGGFEYVFKNGASKDA